MKIGLFKSVFVSILSILFFVSAEAQPPCATNPLADDYCATATPICNLNGYCGNTSATYTNHVSTTNSANETYTPLGNVFCATIQNNSWLKFIADSNIAIFSVWCMNCVHNMGVQMQIYATTDCYNFTAVSNCWNPLQPANGQITATGLIPGNVYYFMIDGTAGDNCDYVIACDVGVNTSPAVSLNQTICTGGTTTVSATGGLTYTWSSNPPDPSIGAQVNNPVITVNPAVTTTYTVIVTNVGQNTFCNTDTVMLNTTVTVNNVTAQLVSFTPANCNQNNGNITVIGNGGTGTYSYVWNTTPPQTTATINNLAPGTYTVTVTSGNCTSILTATIANIPPPSASITSFSNSFCGQNNGNAVIAVTGGMPPLAYEWNTVPPQYTQMLQNVGGGVYTVTVTDNANCTTGQTVTIQEIPGPTVTFDPLQDICMNHLPISLAGGNPAGGTYSGIGVVNNTFDPMLAGVGVFTITYSYTDTNACNAQSIQTIEVLPSPIVTAPTLPGLCISSSPIILMGEIPIGGTYSGTGVNNGSFDPAVSGIGSFEIVYQYINSDGCLSTDTTIQQVFALPVVTQSAIPNVCINTAVMLSGGNPLGGTYSGPGINNGSFDPSITGLGTYTITYNYADTNGCIDSTHANLTVVDIPVVGLSPFSTVCKGIPAFLLTGGTPPGGTYSGISVNNGYFNPVFASTYTITYSITDPNGCTNDTSQYIVVLNLPVVTFASLDDICIDNLPDTLTGGDPPGGTYSGPGVNNGVFDPSVTGAGTFILTYTYNNTACEDTAHQTIIVRPLPNVIFNTIPQVCINVDSVVLSEGVPLGGTYTGLGVNNNYFFPDSTGIGTYSILYTYQDQYNCVDTASQTISINPLPLQFHVDGGGTSCEGVGSPVSLDYSQVGVDYHLVLNGVYQGFPYTGTGSGFSFGNQPTGGTYYILAVDATTNCQNMMLDTAVVNLIPLPDPQLSDSMSLCELPSITLDAGSFSDSLVYLWQNGSTERYYTVIEPGIYWVKVGRGDCIAIDTVEVWNCCNFEIPNVFTPNADQFNDKFIPKYYCELLNYQIDIFNRWGKVVYSSSNIDEGWDGTTQNSGSDCSEGTYFFIINYTSLVYPEVRTDKKLTGSLTLLR